jgi:hypothetical protein
LLGRTYFCSQYLERMGTELEGRIMPTNQSLLDTNLYSFYPFPKPLQPLTPFPGIILSQLHSLLGRIVGMDAAMVGLQGSVPPQTFSIWRFPHGTQPPQPTCLAHMPCPHLTRISCKQPLCTHCLICAAPPTDDPAEPYPPCPLHTHTQGGQCHGASARGPVPWGQCHGASAMAIVNEPQQVAGPLMPHH